MRYAQHYNKQDKYFFFICKLAFAIFLSLFFNDAFAQPRNLRFNYLTTNNGLSNNIVNCVKQDNYGNIWLGTFDGLNRYDGYTIKVFKKYLADPTSIADNMVEVIHLDSQNNLWIGTSNGISLYNPDKENFETYILDTLRYQVNSANKIVGIRENSKRQMFVATDLGFLYRYNRKLRKFEIDRHDFKSIRTFVIDKEDKFWMGGSTGLCLYDNYLNKLTHFSSYVFQGKNVPIHDVNALLEEGDTIWMGTNKGKILYLLKHNMAIHELSYSSDLYLINDIFKSHNGLIYISSTVGLFAYDKKANDFIEYRYLQNNPFGINSLGVNNVYEDKQGNMWVATFQGGADIAVSGKAFNNINQFSKNVALDVKNVHCILEDARSDLWVGSFDGGINVFNPGNGQKKAYFHHEKDPYSLGYGSVYSLFEDHEKNIWVGTYLGYLQKFDRRTEKFISYPFFPGEKNSSMGLDIRSIIEDKEGNLWVISHGNGMSRFNPKTEVYKHYRRDDHHSNSTIADDWPYQLLQDHEGFIWVATPSGLSKFDPKNEAFHNYYSSNKDTNSLCNNHVNVLFEDSNENMWIGTSFGLDLFDRKNNRFVHFYEKDGLPSNQIKSIMEGKPGELWISTSFGISCMRYKQETKTNKIIALFRNYNQLDNLQDNFFWERAAWKTKAGELLFGCEKGLVEFKPDEIQDNTLAPEVYITGFKLFNKEVHAGDNDSLLKHNIRQTAEIRLKNNQNFFSFEFVAINFISKEKNEFAYKLEGFDPQWNYVGSKNEANYTDLQPGEYLFRVKASNNDGYWNEKGTSIRVVILPPIWKTWWCKLLFVILFITFIYFIYLFRVKILRNQNSALENRVEERTRELRGLNKELMEKNNWILAQNQEILSQNQEIYNKNAEIGLQKTLLEKQKGKMEIAFEELTQYRNRLEDLVDERTRELLISKDKAEESDKLKSSFLANLSHEIRTPLNAIIGFSSMMLGSELSSEERLNFNTIIQSSSDTLLNLINDVIDFSKIEAGKLEIIPSNVSLAKVFQQIEELFKLELKKQQYGIAKQIDFKMNVPDEIRSLSISIDESRLIQIISNLINNAIKFTNEGFIETGCKLQNDGTLEFYVKDTGIGIEKGDLEIIFQRFRKVENNNIQIYRGAGLGLSISQHLAHLMGGKIIVQSNPGEGSVFYFSIPVKKVNGNKISNFEMKAFQSVPNLLGISVLVAEDDFANYAYIEYLLQKTNATIYHANNGEETLSLYQKYPDIGLILIDIKMPVMNGIEVLTRLKKLNIQIPVIAQTAYAFSDEIRKINEAGFTDYISKPISPFDLFNAIRNHLNC
jgi:signal transduction histidine kinase/ligand-binding sensor domain-containing protein/CheY-like chemotaxis protein